MSERKLVPGKFVWFELVSSDAKKAQAFYAEVLGWKVSSFPLGSSTYDMVYVGETMTGGYGSPKNASQPSAWVGYVSVEDVDRAAKAAVENGGRIVEPAVDIPRVGRRAVIADPQGAELGIFRSDNGDPPDQEATQGHWMWNELHTPDPARALAFYEKVVGFSHKSVDMGGPGGVYHIISKGGAERGGVTHHLPSGVPAHWLPYVFVDDVDTTIARAKKLGANIPMNPEDIPGIGRFGILRDPTGALLAVMKPLPRQT